MEITFKDIIVKITFKDDGKKKCSIINEEKKNIFTKQVVKQKDETNLGKKNLLN